jgi:hypothetical protein
MRYRLRTLLILLAVLPPLMSGYYATWNACRARPRPVCGGGLKQIGIALHNYHDLATGGFRPAD